MTARESEVEMLEAARRYQHLDDPADPYPAETVGQLSRALLRLHAENEAMRGVCEAAEEWLGHLEKRGARYQDGVPGSLMDAIDAFRQRGRREGGK